jgi:hypothetical protein
MHSKASMEARRWNSILKILLGIQFHVWVVVVDLRAEHLAQEAELPGH